MYEQICTCEIKAHLLPLVQWIHKRRGFTTRFISIYHFAACVWIWVIQGPQTTRLCSTLGKVKRRIHRKESIISQCLLVISPLITHMAESPRTGQQHPTALRLKLEISGLKNRRGRTCATSAGRGEGCGGCQWKVLKAMLKHVQAMGFHWRFNFNCSALNSAAKCFKYMLKVTLCMPSAALSIWKRSSWSLTE